MKPGADFADVAKSFDWCSLWNSTNVSIANASDTVVTFDTEESKSPWGVSHSLVTNTNRLTFLTPGFRIVGAHVQFAANANGSRRQTYIRLNGSNVLAIDYSPPVGGGIPTAYTLIRGYYFAANDYIELIVFQDSGGALNLTTDGVDGRNLWSFGNSVIF